MPSSSNRKTKKKRALRRASILGRAPRRNSTSVRRRGRSSASGSLQGRGSAGIKKFLLSFDVGTSVPLIFIPQFCYGVYNQCESFIYLDLIVKNREILLRDILIGGLVPN
jgi:hypothetical protein